MQLQQAQLQKRIKVWEAVDLWASLYRKKTADSDRLLEQLGLEDKRNAWFMNLSGGQKQRLFIALALINDPEIVFLDELTTGLDPQARHAIWDLVRGIRERGKTVFLTTHLMEEAEGCATAWQLWSTGASSTSTRPRTWCSGIVLNVRLWLKSAIPRRNPFNSIPRVERVERDGSGLRFTDAATW